MQRMGQNSKFSFLDVLSHDPRIYTPSFVNTSPAVLELYGFDTTQTDRQTDGFTSHLDRDDYK